MVCAPLTPAHGSARISHDGASAPAPVNGSPIHARNRAKRSDHVTNAPIHRRSRATYNRTMAIEAGTQYETIIGIEVHAQLRTESKMFCPCPTSPPPGAADEPNTRVCP